MIAVAIKDQQFISTYTGAFVFFSDARVANTHTPAKCKLSILRAPWIMSLVLTPLMSGPFTSRAFHSFQQTMTIVETGTITAILAGIGHKDAPISVRVNITTPNSKFNSEIIEFSPVDAASADVYSSGQLSEGVFVVAGESITIEFLPEAHDSVMGTIQEDSRGHVRMSLVGMRGEEPSIIRKQSVGRAAIPTSASVPAKVQLMEVGRAVPGVFKDANTYILIGFLALVVIASQTQTLRR